MSGLFHGGMMFGLIARDELFLKVNDANRAAYEAAGEAPFSYDTKHGVHTIQSYWRCPPELLDDPENFQVWARRAVEAAVAVGPRKKAPRKPAALLGIAGQVSASRPERPALGTYLRPPESAV